MAMTNAEKLKVVTLLGWPARTLDPTALSYSNIIARRFENLDDDAISIMRDYLDRIDTMDSKLLTAIGRAGVKSIDDIEFFGNEKGSSEFAILRNERKRLLVELAGIIDIAIGPAFNGGMMQVSVVV